MYFCYKEGLSIAVKLAESIERSCTDGGMLAILYNYQHYYENPNIYVNTEIAAINFDSHFIVSEKFQSEAYIIFSPFGRDVENLSKVIELLLK